MTDANRAIEATKVFELKVSFGIARFTDRRQAGADAIKCV